MASTLLLDTVAWDLVLDANGNIAVAGEPYSLAQDAASAIRTYLGECYWDTTLGMPYQQSIFGKAVSLGAIKALMQQQAEAVPDVVSAQVFLASSNDRVLTGQVQVTSASTGKTSVASFAVANPQGVG